MPLQPNSRVVLKTNTLLNVGALVRFPAILKIAVDPPAQFQDAIRSDYPQYFIVDATQVPLPPNVPPEVQNAIRSAMQSQLGLTSARAHRFLSVDGIWSVQLAQDYVVLGCSKYPKWEIYKTRLERVFSLLLKLYQPAYASAVSLRYQNGIVRSQLGLQKSAWGQLLGDLTRGVFSDPKITEEEVSLCANQFDLRGPEETKARVRHGLGKVVGTNEPVYTIDNEFLTEERVALDDVLTRFDKLHDFSGILYRQCISPYLFNVLGPTGPE